MQTTELYFSRHLICDLAAQPFIRSELVETEVRFANGENRTKDTPWLWICVEPVHFDNGCIARNSYTKWQSAFSLLCAFELISRQYLFMNAFSNITLKRLGYSIQIHLDLFLLFS